MSMKTKKLSLAIYWHMHQPVYEIEGTYLMPWVRLHALKDYLDMVSVLEKFPKLKLNLNIVAGLLDSLLDYVENNSTDIHMQLSTVNISAITEEEKSFILNNFFSPKFETMIYRSENYKKLYKKRFSKDYANIEEFSQQELSDLIALFNLVWIDSTHYETYPRLKYLWEKQYNYTIADRLEIIDIQKSIMKQIVPTIKKYIKDGRIEITTSPYYHPILPILLGSSANTKSTKKNSTSIKMYEYANLQIVTALDRIESIFGVRPKGMWPPELCLCDKTLSLLAKCGLKWTLSDEGILANSINYDFIRDFKGNLNDPYHLLKVYEYKTQNSSLNIIFRDRSIPNLINFEYAGMNSKIAANDLYDKIKVIQNKLLVSPDEKHLLTIASDGENCWENYQNDGREFLESIYSLIENDDSLETVLISDYIESDNQPKKLTKIQSGSWIDNSFQFWIGDDEKNKAWLYIIEASAFINKHKKHKKYNNAIRELLIAQGSDWFWWYGEPNNSGQDFIFDYMFRERLKNVYICLDNAPPEYLNKSIITTIEVPFKHSRRAITPRMDGSLNSFEDWYHAGSISMLDGPVYKENKNVEKIYFGCDNKNIYFRLHINKDTSDVTFLDKINQFYIYIRNASNLKERAYIRLINKTDNTYAILSEKFEYELTLTLVKETLYPPRLSTVLHPNIWTLDSTDDILIVYRDVIDICIPFDKIGVAEGETVEFFMANTDSGVKNSAISQEFLLSVLENINIFNFVIRLTYEIAGKNIFSNIVFFLYIYF